MMNVRIFETAYHLYERVDLSDMTKKFVSQPFSSRRTFDKASDVDEFNCGRDDNVGLGDLPERFQTRVRHSNYTDIRINRAKWVVSRLSFACPSNGIEQGGLANVR
jgi:hypothetical protein